MLCHLAHMVTAASLVSRCPGAACHRPVAAAPPAECRRWAGRRFLGGSVHRSFLVARRSARRMPVCQQLSAGALLGAEAPSAPAPASMRHRAPPALVSVAIVLGWLSACASGHRSGRTAPHSLDHRRYRPQPLAPARASAPRRTAPPRRRRRRPSCTAAAETPALGSPVAGSLDALPPVYRWPGRAQRRTLAPVVPHV